MSKVANAIRMLELLNSGRKYSISELSEILEVTPRMIRSYKDELEQAGIYIDTIRGPYGGYVLNNRIDLPKRNSSRQQLVISDEEKEKINLINNVIKNGGYLEIRYNDIVRIVEPIELFVYHNYWILVSYCQYRNAVRSYHVKKIDSIRKI